MNDIAPTPNLIGIGIDALQHSSPKTIAEVEQHAKEFEGLFISLLVKEMRSTTEEGGFFGGESSDSYGSLFDMFIGEHLAEAQPLGIASLWMEQYRQNNAPIESNDESKFPKTNPNQPINGDPQ